MNGEEFRGCLKANSALTAIVGQLHRFTGNGHKATARLPRFLLNVRPAGPFEGIHMERHRAFEGPGYRVELLWFDLFGPPSGPRAPLSMPEFLPRGWLYDHPRNL